MKKISWIFLLVIGYLDAQNLPLNTWRSHYSYSDARILVRANETLFCAAENGLMSLDLASFETRTFGKENGLGDAGVTAMHFVEAAEVLVVGYESGTIDLLHSDGKITNIRTVRDAPIVAEKAIRSITSNGQRAYLATGFGVVYLDVANERVIESYRSIGEEGAQLSIDEVLATEDSLYVISNQGIQAGSFEDNLLDFNDWVMFDETESSNFSQLVSHDEKLHVVANGSELWTFSGTEWVATGVVFEEDVTALFSGKNLLALSSTKVFSVDEDGIETLSGIDQVFAGNDLLVYDGKPFIADGELGLLNDYSQIYLRRPLNDHASKMRSFGGVTYLVFGPAPEAYDGSFDNLGYSSFFKGDWANEEIYGFSNITDVALVDSRLFFSSMGNGLYDSREQVSLDELNAGFAVSDGVGTVDLTSLAVFNDELWISSFDSDQSMYRLSAEELTPYDEAETGTKYPVDFEFSNQGVLWVRKSSFEGGGITVYSPFSEEQRTFTTASGLPSSNTTGLVINSEDKAWISTSDGIANYDGASFPFNSFNINVPIFENRLLFEDEQINDVITDGGDRIWVATEQNGAWVLAADLSEVVAQFTTENSPLPSNSVEHFSYDGESGEMFIATARGLVSYGSASSTGLEKHQGSITVFPNPVSPGYNGEVGFSGVVKNSVLKITDVKGRLVKELKANGSTASWDLSTFSGGRAQSGVYLVFSSSEDGQETLVGKVAVLK